MLALGHAEVTDQLGRVEVVETLTCAHCNRIYRKPGPSDPAGFCHQCFRPVCLSCGQVDRCVPFERRLEVMERRSNLLRACGL